MMSGYAFCKRRAIITPFDYIYGIDREFYSYALPK